MSESAIENNYPIVLKNDRPKTLAELYSRPSRWNKGHNARNKDEESVDEKAPCAINWCIQGGLNLVYGERSELAHQMADKLLSYIKEHYPEFHSDDVSLTGWNDSDSIRFKDVRRVCLGAGV
jgi:hypothetical protein